MNANRGNFRHIAYAFKTDVGKARKNNEDALGAFPEGGVFCVADGMGGGDDGEIASAAVVKAVDDVSRRCATGAGHAAEDVASALEEGLSEASAWIWKRANSKKISVCGSTFVGVVFDSTAPAKAMAIHAGDSRAYLIRGKNAKRITRDHSAAEMMGEKDESKVNPLFRSMIVNAVGIRKSVECERTPFKVAGGDRVLICSDGLYRMVPDKRIGEISSRNPDVEKAVDALVSAALAGGGVDNVSVVLCEIGEFPEALAAEPVPASSGGNSAMADVVGEEGDSTSDESNATRETIMPVFESPGEEPGKEPVPQPATHRRPWMLLALLLSLGMLAAAAFVMLADREPAEAAPPAVPPPVQPMPTPPVAKPHQVVRPEDPATNAALRTEPQELPLLVTDRTDVVTNVPIVDVPSPIKADEPASPAAVAPSASTMPAVEAETRPCASFISACEARTVADFAAALKKWNASSESQREFDEQLRRFRESAKICARMRSEKCVWNAVVDLKYVLAAAEAAKERLEGTSSDGPVRKFVDDWALVASGSERDLLVQEACARLMLNAPGLKSK